MNLLGRHGTRTQFSHPRPIVIDCIGALDDEFAGVFRNALAKVDLAQPVLVEFKRAKVDDMRGIVAMAESIGARRTAGGYAAFVTESNRWRGIFERSGIPQDYVVTAQAMDERRRIILAEASRPHALAAR